MSPSPESTPASGKAQGGTELCVAFWLEVSHAAAGDIAAGEGPVYLTGLLPPLSRFTTDNECAHCGGQRWLFKAGEGEPDERRVLLTGHNDGCGWFRDMIARALAEGALGPDGRYVPPAERRTA